jgi:hypothetical protein
MTGEWPEEQIDHINRNPLDNSFLNLRKATMQQNLANRGRNSNNKTGYKGVSFVPNRKKYFATVRTDDGPVFCGLHNTAEDAARAYDRKAKRLLGAFAWQNFPEKSATISRADRDWLFV